MVSGLVLNVQRYCLHDGPGIRTTVFLKGCPLACRWCHNPESRPSGQQIGVVRSRCVRCGHCVEACPQHATQADRDPLARLEGASSADSEPPFGPAADCTLCGACVAACPTGARHMVGRDMSVGEVVSEVLRDGVFHDQSSGGVTLSGGEPLAQPEFTVALLRAFRQRSVHTALDTCGYAARDVIQEAAPLVSLFLYDVKCLDDRRHRAFTGVSNKVILENLETLSALHANIWIRVPLVPGFNLDDDLLGTMARYLATLGGVRQVHLLPYHRFGTHKSPRVAETTVEEDAGNGVQGAHMSREPRSPDILNPQQLDRAADLFRAAGLRTFTGG